MKREKHKLTELEKRLRAQLLTVAAISLQFLEELGMQLPAKMSKTVYEKKKTYRRKGKTQYSCVGEIQNFKS